jgi:hypothetical protein
VRADGGVTKVKAGENRDMICVVKFFGTDTDATGTITLGAAYLLRAQDDKLLLYGIRFEQLRREGQIWVTFLRRIHSER